MWQHLVAALSTKSVRHGWPRWPVFNLFVFVIVRCTVSLAWFRRIIIRCVIFSPVSVSRIDSLLDCCCCSAVSACRVIFTLVYFLFIGNHSDSKRKIPKQKSCSHFTQLYENESIFFSLQSVFRSPHANRVFLLLWLGCFCYHFHFHNEKFRSFPFRGISSLPET